MIRQSLVKCMTGAKRQWDNPAADNLILVIVRVVVVRVVVVRVVVVRVLLNSGGAYKDSTSEASRC